MTVKLLRPRLWFRRPQVSVWWVPAEFWVGCRVNVQADCVEICLVPTILIRWWP